VSIGSFILRRLGSGLLSVLGVSILVFLFLHMIPGDPIDHLLGEDASAADRKKIEKCMGLDKSLPEQFVGFLGHVADGTLGPQCRTTDTGDKRTVASRIGDVLPYTVRLAVLGLGLAVLFALPLGVLAAVRRGTWIDTAATVFSLSGIAMPMMLMAPLLLLVFFASLGWLPGPTDTGAAAIILPALAIATHLMAMLARMTRSSMVEVLGEDFVRTARAKGLPERTVLAKHALRNALLPVITIAGLQFGSLLSGAIIVEKVFARPGLGLTLLDAIAERNYPLVQGSVFVIAVMYVLVNLAVDLAYGLADPRIRRA
jgi:ABC-type dipeptide/oligopeptide/nickel transport system permease component